jgi:hypothetical protein
VLGLQVTATGLNLPTVARIDLGHAGVLKNTSSRCSDGRTKADEILHGIELSLIPKSQCTDGIKRQRRSGKHVGLETKGCARPPLLLRVPRDARYRLYKRKRPSARNHNQYEAR